MTIPLLRISGLRKAFPGVLALSGVDFELGKGEIHAVVGKNGAGKSTLISVISGALVPDDGSFEFDQNQIGVHELGTLPVATVYQESTVFPNLTVAQNVFAGNEPASWYGVDRAAEHIRTANYLRMFGISAEPDDVVANLSPAEQKVIAIIRAFAKDCRILILDEPTATLSLGETNRLFELLRQTRATGLSIIFISHRLEEIFQIADRVTVLRDGHTVLVSDTASIDVRRLVAAIVGAADAAEVADRPRQEFLWESTVCFEARSLSHAAGRFRDVSFEVRRGEIMGLAGLVGAGKTEVGKAIFGAERIRSGELLLGGVPRNVRSPADAIRQGIIYVPEDRKHEGLFGDMTIAANVCVAVLDELEDNLHMLHHRTLATRARRALDGFNVRATGVDQLVATLSGGNQQKVLLARWLQLEPKLLIVDEPTIGVDVSAREEIYHLLRRIAAAGTGVIFISCDLKELLQNADRIVTMYNGEIRSSYSALRTTEQQLLESVSGSPAVVN